VLVLTLAVYCSLEKYNILAIFLGHFIQYYRTDVFVSLKNVTGNRTTNRMNVPLSHCDVVDDVSE